MEEYRRAITSLFARTGGAAKLGLERTSVLLERLDNPHRRFRSFHVAGTNGKGSVVAMLYALLRAKGLSVGRYTSPHLVDFRERIVVDDEEVNPDEVLAFLRRWEPFAEEIGATFFEITTVLAFDHFARRGVDVAVIETGMGGRLDATNVVTPLAAGITSVSLDHAEYLGDSLTAIAREKAGIFKPGVPAVIGSLSPEARAEVVRCAGQAQVSILLEAAEAYPVRNVTVSAEGTDVDFGFGGQVIPVRIGLVGAVQAQNASVALAMLDAAGPDYRTPLAEAARVLPGVQLSGRFQRLGRFVIDVAHNIEGFRTLRETLDAVKPARPLIGVIGILRDKDWPAMLRLLSPVLDRVVLTRPATAPEDRVLDLQEARRAWHDGWGPLETAPLLGTALRDAHATAGTVLVTGSFHTAGEALAQLDREPAGTHAR